MFVGYCPDHAGDCYKMYNPQTNRCHITRDVKWLKRMYFKDVRFYNNENLNKLKAGKSVSQTAQETSENYGDITEDDDDEIQTVNDELEIIDEESSTNDEEEKENTDEEDYNDNEEDNNDSDEDRNEDNPYKTSTEDRGQPQTTTKSGRISYAPKFYYITNKPMRLQIRNSQKQK